VGENTDIFISSADADIPLLHVIRTGMKCAEIKRYYGTRKAILCLFVQTAYYEIVRRILGAVEIFSMFQSERLEEEMQQTELWRFMEKCLPLLQ
jgi:hypothetical protein